MRMLLVVRDGRARDRFIEELAALGADCDVAGTSEELLAATRHARYNGVLFDVPTLIRTRELDRRLLQSLAEIYPSVRLKHDPATDAIYALGTEAGPGSRDGLSVFVAACRDFLPRGLRRGERVDAHLPAVLWRAPPDGGAGGEKTCTLNISYLGCFVFTASCWSMSEPAWIVFPDVTAEAARVRVAWYEPWGARRAVPGVGLAFLDIPEALYGELKLLGCEPVDFEVARSAKGL
ncbi:MAG: PilZ domain-containing protein [Solidesulfovibrio sp.]|uniref:PilZ domain-containing protein n=1 Tax=Solidesulfovibrio sp. TaxID=2910990 RepID=UPI002B208CE7|nr:PilZ domain-containing protein [Solidesulfovibrio sp.]MEA4858657.1 PilZ domain-containing protein [Solidesulfovibrio sp.]